MNQFFLDRQYHLSIFHEKLELTVSGANSRCQPVLATFRETVSGRTSHLPVSTALRMEPGLDRLFLAYTFSADVEVAETSSQQVAFRFAVTEMGPVEEAQLAIQLVLTPGEVLETTKTLVMLGLDRRELGPDDVAGLVRRRGWSLRVDSPAASSGLSRLQSLCKCSRDVPGPCRGRSDGAHPAPGRGRTVPQNKMSGSSSRRRSRIGLGHRLLQFEQ